VLIKKNNNTILTYLKIKMGRKTLDLSGQQFGNLTAIEFSHIKNRKSYWKFKCNLCKNEHKACAADVKRGKIKSCGCEKNTGSNNGHWKGYEELNGSVCGHYRRNAESRGIEFKVTTKDLWNQFKKQNELCPYTGIKLTLYSKEKRIPDNASLDRIYSNKGYTKDNIHWIYKPINVMKNNTPHEEFIEICCLIAENHKKS